MTGYWLNREFTLSANSSPSGALEIVSPKGGSRP